MDTLTGKQHILELVERLRPEDITAAVRFLESLLVSVDDEPVTGEDRQRLVDGHAWFAERGGKGIPMEDVLAGFGLKAEDFPQ